MTQSINNLFLSSKHDCLHPVVVNHLFNVVEKVAQEVLGEKTSHIHHSKTEPSGPSFLPTSLAYTSSPSTPSHVTHIDNSQRTTIIHQPTTIVNQSPASSSSSAKEEEKKEENHTLVGVLASIVFLGLAFIFGTSTSEKERISKDLNKVNEFDAALFKAEVEANLIYDPGNSLMSRIIQLKHVNSLAKDILEKKESNTFIKRILIISGIAASTLVAYGSFYNVTKIRHAGLITSLLTAGYALYHFGRTWTDNSMKETANEIQANFTAIKNECGLLLN